MSQSNRDTKKTISIVVLTEGTLEVKQIDFPNFFFDKIFATTAKLAPFIKAFDETKKEPTKSRVDSFYFDLIKKVDPEYNHIDSMDDFLKAFAMCECFADFVDTQPPSFQIQLLQYLSS